MSYADGYADVRQYNNKRRLMAALMREALKTYDDESSLFAGLPDAAQLERVAEQIEAKLESDEKIWETYMKGEEVPADQAARMLKLALLAMEAGAINTKPLPEDTFMCRVITTPQGYVLCLIDVECDAGVLYGAFFVTRLRRFPQDHRVPAVAGQDE